MSHAKVLSDVVSPQFEAGDVGSKVDNNNNNNNIIRIQKEQKRIARTNLSSPMGEQVSQSINEMDCLNIYHAASIPPD